MPLFAHKNDWSQAGNNFDFLRLVLASLVIVSHAYPLFIGAADPWQAHGSPFNIGQMCVMAFFAISGMLVTRSAILSRSVLSYIVSRVMRLLPGAFICALLMTFALGLVFTTLGIYEYLTDGSVWSFLRRNTMLMSIQYDLPGVFKDNVYPGAVNGSLWSLRVEIRMYMLFGVIVFLARLRPEWMRHLKYLLMVLFVVAYFGAILPPLLPEGVLTPKTNWIYGYYFAAGAVLLCWEHVIPRNLIVAVVLFIASLFTVNTPFLDPAMRLTLPYLVYCFAFSQATALKRLRGAPDISYGIYIYGFPVQQSLSALFADRFGLLPLTTASLAITVVLASLSWKLVEKPALTRKRAVEDAMAGLYRRVVPVAGA
ncbi:acyltransferase family protein [Shinella zoogloeoides]|uniref:acyltransferase family protein n=1 Tax=Shinella zoogloeoides TaxID=352475 RepID=UPI000E652B42|nr:acyltransferase [Shinella zoogloeoides]